MGSLDAIAPPLEERHEGTRKVFGVNDYATPFQSSFPFAYLAVVPSGSRAIQLSSPGPKRSSAGGIWIKCASASLQPVDTGVRQAQPQHSDAIPSSRHQRRDQANVS